MATCTYQEEPPWLDYPTVRHAKRWPSLDLVDIPFRRPTPSTLALRSRDAGAVSMIYGTVVFQPCNDALKR